MVDKLLDHTGGAAAFCNAEPKAFLDERAALRAIGDIIVTVGLYGVGINGYQGPVTLVG